MARAQPTQEQVAVAWRGSRRGLADSERIEGGVDDGQEEDCRPQDPSGHAGEPRECPSQVGEGRLGTPDSAESCVVLDSKDRAGKWRSRRYHIGEAERDCQHRAERADRDADHRVCYEESRQQVAHAESGQAHGRLVRGKFGSATPHGGDIGIEESMPMAAVSSLAQAGSSNARPPSSDKRSTSRTATSECKSPRQAPQSGPRKAGWINL